MCSDLGACEAWAAGIFSWPVVCGLASLPATIATRESFLRPTRGQRGTKMHFVCREDRRCTGRAKEQQRNIGCMSLLFDSPRMPRPTADTRDLIKYQSPSTAAGTATRQRGPREARALRVGCFALKDAGAIVGMACKPPSRLQVRQGPAAPHWLTPAGAP